MIVLLEDVVLVPACWEALILGCDDKALGQLLLAVCWYSLGPSQPVSPFVGSCAWSAFDSHLDLSCWRPWCLALAFAMRV